MSEFHRPIERLEKRASEKEPVARLSSNEDGLNDPQLAELLRRRIEELDRRLAILKKREREKFGPLEKPLDGVRRLDDTYVVATLTRDKRVTENALLVPQDIVLQDNLSLS
jgi:hypothetical protein